MIAISAELIYGQSGRSRGERNRRQVQNSEECQMNIARRASETVAY